MNILHRANFRNGQILGLQPFLGLNREFSPKYVVPYSQLNFWFSAESLLATLNDGDPVASMTCVGGSGRTATQGTEGYKPIFHTNHLNGYPAIVFDGIDDRLAATSSLSSAYHTNIIVAKATATHEIDSEASTGTTGTSGQKWLVEPAHGGSYPGFGISFGTNGISIYHHYTGVLAPPLVYQETLTDYIVLVHMRTSWNRDLLMINGGIVRWGLNAVYSYTYSSGGMGGGSYGYFAGEILDWVQLNGQQFTPALAISEYFMKRYAIPGTPRAAFGYAI